MFELVKAEKANYPIAILCSVLSVSRSGFYAWQDRPEPARAAADAALVIDIRAAHKLERRSVRKPDHFDRLRRGDRLRGPECDRLRAERRAPGGADDRSDVESAEGVDPARAEDAEAANEEAVWLLA
jgi:hypothetical protein